MADTDTYPGVDTDEEKKKKSPYPMPIPSAATAPMPAAMPPPEVAGAIPPTFPTQSSPSDPAVMSREPESGLVRRGDAMAPAPTSSNGMPAPTVMGGAAQPPIPSPPRWSEYAPPRPSTAKRIGQGIAEFIQPSMRNFFAQPEERAKEAHGAATNEYKEELGAGEAARKETSEAELKGAQATEAKARGEAATASAAKVPVVINGVTYDVPQKDAEKLIGTGLTQAGANQRNVNTVTGAGERNAATIKGAGEREASREATQKDIAGEKAGDAGTWTIQEDANGNPIEFNSKTGATRPAPNIQKSGTKNKADAAKEKLTEPVDTALGYADDYLSNGAFTGPGDEALQEKFFELAKPATGFRMTQPQMDMLRNSRGWMSGAEAHLRHMATGTWFSNDQRQQIVNTMKELGEAKKKAITGEGEGGGNQKPKGQWNAKTGRYE